IVGHCLVDQLRELDARLDRIVVEEAKFRHAVELEPVRKLAPQVTSGVLERRDDRSSLLAAAQMRDEDLRVRKVRGHVHRGDLDHADARVLDLEPEQLGQLALDRVADALRARRMFFHCPSSCRSPRVRGEGIAYNVRDTSTISYTSS